MEVPPSLPEVPWVCVWATASHSYWPTGPSPKMTPVNEDGLHQRASLSLMSRKPSC